MCRCDLNIKHTLFLAMIILIGGVARAQCPRVFDFYGVSSSSPYWYSCTGNDFSFNLQSAQNWGQYTVNWGDGSPLTSGMAWNSPAILNHVYSAVVDTFVVTVTETLTGCTVQGVVVMEEATSSSIQIPVGGLTQSCAPQVMEFINSSTNVSETTVFTWDFGDGSPNLVFDHTNWQQTISHLYDVGTVDCETEVSLVSENYCNTVQGGSSEATFNPIRIWDLDDPGISASATLLCYPDTTVTFTNSTERNCFFQGNIYQRYEYWNFGDYWGLGHDSIIDWTPWPPTFPHTMHYPGIGSYTVQLLDSNYCGIAPTSITIQIVPPPVAGIAASADTVCLGQPITFYQQATGSPNSWKWNFGVNPVWISTGSGNVTYVFNQPGTYTVQSQVAITGSSSACNDVASVQVVVLPPPTVQVTASPPEACDQEAIQFGAVTSNSVNWQWTFDVAPGSFNGQIPPLVQLNTPGIHSTSLTVTSSNGCTATDDIQVTIHESPEAVFSVQNLCEGDTAHFWDNTVSLPNSPVVSWSWDFGDGIVSAEQNPDHLYTSTGQFDVELVVSNGHCQDSVSTSVIVEAAPVADISVDLVSGCSPLNVQFGNNSSAAVSYLWNLGDGTISNEFQPSHTYSNTTSSDLTYTIVLTAFNAFGCASNDTLYLQVLANATASFTDNNAIPVCSPYQATFNNTSQNASSFAWDFGDGSGSLMQNPVHQYINTSGFIQTYNVTLIAYSANGCHDTISDPLIVFPLAEYNFDISPSSGCAPLSVQMPFVAGVQSYFWDFGDGVTSAMPVPVHLYQNSGSVPVTYNLSLIGVSPFGCVDTAYSSVVVNPAPVAQFSLGMLSGCSPLEVPITNLSANSTVFHWNYGDGSSSEVLDPLHSHVFINTTNQTQTRVITLTAETFDGCSSVFQVSVDVYPQVTASFADPGPRCAPATIDFNGTSSNGDYFEWNFGNGLGAFSEDAQSTFINVSDSVMSFNVALMVSSDEGCSAMYTLPVEIHPLPMANFVIEESQACSPAPLQITNLSELATSYTWNYGDGTMSNNTDSIHIHVFGLNGQGSNEFDITLLAETEAGCQDFATAHFELFPEVTAGFAGNAQGCSPLNAMFVNQSVGAVSFEWLFGDGAVSNLNNPSHIYTAGSTEDITYSAQLIAFNEYGCSDTVSSPILVYHTPLAIAQIDSLFGCYPQQVTLYNGSIGADSFQWVYGTGVVSNTAEQYHTVSYYNYTTGLVTYDITLNAHTLNGCSSSDQLQVEVAPDMNADFTVNAAGCTPLVVYFDNNSEGAFSNFWDFGDGDISNEPEPVHTFFNWSTSDTVYTVHLIIQNVFGCTDTADAFVQVFPVPVAGFEADPLVQTWPDATVNFDNTTIGGDLNFIWNMGDGSQDLTPEPGSHTYSTWGNYMVQLQAGNGSCADTIYQEVIILAPPPVADFIGPAEGCAPLAVNFTNLSEYAMSSYWQFGDGGAANTTNPVYTYYQPGTYTVTLTVYGFDGTTDVMTQEFIIHVYPRAVAAFTVTPNQVAVPSQPVYCLNLSQNADSFEWFFGDGSSSVLENPVYLYENEGMYDVILVANNEHNCPDTMLVVNAVYAKAGGMIDFPNAFTPRSMGGGGGSYDPLSFENDVFFPLHKGVVEYHLQIFNKWGELLFESKDVNKGWDGYYRGSLSKQDVYVWKVRARFVDGQKYENAGDVTLLVK